MGSGERLLLGWLDNTVLATTEFTVVVETLRLAAFLGMGGFAAKRRNTIFAATQALCGSRR
jgi:hypothetical protein